MNVIGNEPVHVPFDTERKSPMFGVPLLATGIVITGYDVLTGGVSGAGGDDGRSRSTATTRVEPAAFERE